jgi:hypothetical protein
VARERLDKSIGSRSRKVLGNLKRECKLKPSAQIDDACQISGHEVATFDHHGVLGRTRMVDA